MRLPTAHRRAWHLAAGLLRQLKATDVSLIILYGMVFQHLTYLALFLVILGLATGLTDRCLRSDSAPAKGHLISLATARRLPLRSFVA